MPALLGVPAPLPLSPIRLPVRPGVFAYDRKGGMETFGVFEDALPDGWGRRIVDARFRIPSRSRAPFRGGRG